MRAPTSTRTKFVVRLPDGYAGRMTLTAAMGAVDLAFASVFYSREEAQLVADWFEVGVVEEL